LDKINVRNVERIKVPDIIRVIKSRRMRWVGYVSRIGEIKISYRVLVRNLEGKRPHGIPRLRREVFQKWDVEACTGLRWLRKGTGGGHV